MHRLSTFLEDTRAGATAVFAAAVTVMTVGATALVVDHTWLVGQRDTLKSAADAAAIAATQHMVRRSGSELTDDELETELTAAARRYILLNLTDMSDARYTRASDTLTVEVSFDRGSNTVEVDASADLGGTLFARNLPLLGSHTGPDRMTALSGTLCGGGVIELMLALDVTASMKARVDSTDGQSPKRIETAIDAAKTLVETLYTGCEDSDVVVGIVPWDKTIRLPAPDAWAADGWADTSAYTNAESEDGHEAWGGCVADRSHGRSDPKTSEGLSLTLPSAEAFPAFLYPDTNDLDPTLISEVRDTIRGRLNLPASLDATAVDALLLQHSENPWNATGHGPNFHCTHSPLMVLTSSRSEVEVALDALYDTSRSPSLWGGVTMAHLGITWGRRMLAPSWRAVWGDSIHPVDAGDDVTKVLVLLTDGRNGAYADGWSTLPGRLSAELATSGDTLAFGCDSRSSGCHIVHGDNAMTSEYASRHTAVGRFGDGRAEDGFSVDGEDFTYAGSAGEAETRLTELMTDSCELAHEEGIAVYTVALFDGSRTVNTQWKNKLVACAGTADTKTTAEREKFYLEGSDEDSLVQAFEDIGDRIITIRRTS